MAKEEIPIINCESIPADWESFIPFPAIDHITVGNGFTNRDKSGGVGWPYPGVLPQFPLYPSTNPPFPTPTPSPNIGWICPKCGAGCNPSTMVCPCKDKYIPGTSSTGPGILC